MNRLFIYSVFISVMFLTLSILFALGFPQYGIERNVLDSFFCFTVFLTFFLGLKDLYRRLEKGKAHLYTGSVLSIILGISMLLMFGAEIFKNFIENETISLKPDTGLIIIVLSSLCTLPGLISFKGRKIHH